MNDLLKKIRSAVITARIKYLEWQSQRLQNRVCELLRQKRKLEKDTHYLW